MEKKFALKGNIIYSKNLNELEVLENGYLVCNNGKVEGVYKKLPEQIDANLVKDYGNNLIIPGFTDLHIHAPQYQFRALKMDLELLDWLEQNTFPEEAKYKDLEYADKAYDIFVENLKRSSTTRACIFATIHPEATLLLMDKLEKSGLATMVGKVNMDRNSPDYLVENSYEQSIENTINWIEKTYQNNYKNTSCILTPRFTPTCSDDLMQELKKVQLKYNLPLQSHLSENPSELLWVKELCPWSKSYGDAYDKFGLFGKDTKTIMAHCVYSSDDETDLIKENGVFIAHCPESNTNLSSGIAPIRKYLDMGLKVGIGSDVAGGSTENIFSAMAQAIQVSKLRWRLVEDKYKPLTVEEVFYMATEGGGEFFGKVGSFKPEYEFDALIIDDSRLETTINLTLKERLERMIYLGDERDIVAKYVKGKNIL